MSLSFHCHYFFSSFPPLIKWYFRRQICTFLGCIMCTYALYAQDYTYSTWLRVEAKAVLCFHGSKHSWNSMSLYSRLLLFLAPFYEAVMGMQYLNLFIFQNGCSAYALIALFKYYYFQYFSKIYSKIFCVCLFIPFPINFLNSWKWLKMPIINHNTI